MLRISDADIARAEYVLLPAGCVFNEERRNFIKCMESRDVVACPGSGKTTALLAKLLILASYMPFFNGRGVCVLTHTNVAIDEIKRRAGGAADVLFGHPNYFGTIQGFVNRFLAIPAYRNMYKQPIQAIDNDSFFAALRPRYQRDVGLQRWLEPRGGIGTLGGYWFKPIDLTIGSDMDNDISRLSRGTSTYRKIEDLRRAVLRQGILSFNDAYSLGLNHLFSFPGVAEAIRHRFKFVFVDEMQDTDAHQFRVIDGLFAGCNTVILQRMGDPNQAIYQSDVEQKMLWSPTDPALPFSDSLRYGASIAKVLDTVRVDRTLTLEPNPNQHSLPPHMLLFDSGAEETVLPTFGALIREQGLHELESSRFCAVGWVGKDKTEEGKVCLRYYHREYQKMLKSNSRWFWTLLSYAHAMDLSLRDNPQNAGALNDIALAAVVRALRLGGHSDPKTQRPFTFVTLKSHLKQNNGKLLAALCLNLSEWVLFFRQGEMTVLQLREAISAFIRRHFVNGESAELTDFFESDTVNFTPPANECACANTFVSDAGDVIEVGTVHSVKGETYTATLYLETFYYALDSKRLLPFCSGHYPRADSKKARHRANLKIAHVAFSRPTHLLAFACCNEHAAGHEAELESAGWIIRKI
jgi:DNA helicase II / ATP-dependent DNA helicase PcrA